MLSNRNASRFTVVSALLSLLIFSGSAAHAVSARGTVRQFVMTALSIFNVSDLNFGFASPGDAQRTIAPESAETPSNGSFRVVGEPSATYTILLPRSTTMTVAGGGSHETIEVRRFTSTPVSGGRLDSAGQQMIYIGATRDALDVNQTPGSYTGTYVVTVVY